MKRLKLVDFLGYLCYLKYILKIEKSNCNRKNQIAKFDKFNTKFNKTHNMLHHFLCLFVKKIEFANVFYSKNPLHNNNHE